MLNYQTSLESIILTEKLLILVLILLDLPLKLFPLNLKIVSKIFIL